MQALKYAVALLAMAAAIASPQAHAQTTYPSQSVTIVVPLAAGGLVDTIIRTLAPRLSEVWKQPVVIENRPGANTQIGAHHVARSAPEGHILLASTETTFVINQNLYSKLSYDPDRDFAPVSGLGLVNQLLIVHPSVQARSMQELIALAKAKPGQITYGTFGIGSSSHLNMEQLQHMAGIKMQPVHFKGGAPALTALMGGHIDALFISTIPSTIAAWKEGRARALATGGRRRLAEFPDLPTVADSGLSDFEGVSYVGLVAPRQTPPAVVAKINADVQAILADPEYQAKHLEPLRLAPIRGTPQEFAAYLQADTAKWAKIMQAAGIRVD